MIGRIKLLKTIITAFLVSLIICLLSLSGVFNEMDNFIKDTVYQYPSTPSSKIKIIAIDENTVGQYGNYEDWSREQIANLISLLNSNEQSKPEIIAIDVLYIGERDENGDNALAKACQEGQNVILASRILFEDRIAYDSKGQAYLDTFVTAGEELPYEKVREHVGYGFANTIQDPDGFIRHAMTTVDLEGTTRNSFALEIYQRFCKNHSLTTVLPNTIEHNIFSFLYTGNPGDYEIISLADVMNQKVPISVFNDSIVFIGAYASGMMDNYSVPIDRSQQMYGVEIQANIVQSLIDCKTVTDINYYAYLGIAFLAYAALFIILSIIPLKWGLVLSGVSLVLHFVVGRILQSGHKIMPLAATFIAIILITVVQVGMRYVLESLHKRKVINTFKKYVAPQVVDAISKKGDFEVKVGGDRRHIAVLFMDVRGFTTLSEGLDPEKVVGILNRLLTEVTEAVFHNGGTLDKFIGDAAMAVFNAPFDQEDYCYQSVKTGLEIIERVHAIGDELNKTYNVTIDVGIGIHCGEAIVGNIGSDTRMDYTAIGDTVNTASRLESNAKRGQVLISQTMKDNLGERIIANSIGAISLKGKENRFEVYEVEKLL